MHQSRESNLKRLGWIFQVWVAKSKMASTSGDGGHGGKRRNSGRKKIRFNTPTRARKEWWKCHKRIYLEENIFKTWLESKFVAGYDGCSDWRPNDLWSTGSEQFSRMRIRDSVPLKRNSLIRIQHNKIHPSTVKVKKCLWNAVVKDMILVFLAVFIATNLVLLFQIPHVF